MANTKKNLQLDSDSSSSSSCEGEVESLPHESKLKRPRSKANLSTADPKKSKTPGVKEVKKPVPFERIWSEEDEISVLQGMLDYKDQTGSDPKADSNNFFDFIKSSLNNANLNQQQVGGKVKKLKVRIKKIKTRKTLTPHETILIQFWDKIWGQEVEAKPNANTTTEIKTEAGNCSEEHNHVNFLGKASLAMGLNEAIVAAGLRLCSEDTKSEIETKWRKLHAEESHLYIKKLDLAREEMEMITAALRSVSGGL